MGEASRTASMVPSKPEPKKEPGNPSTPAMQDAGTEEGLTSRNLETGREGKRASEEQP